MINVVRVQAKDIYGIFEHFDRRFHLKDEYAVYVLYDNCTPISTISVAFEGKNCVKVHASYTVEKYRKKGYFECLLRYVLLLYRDKDFKADCLPASFGVFSKCGFELIEKQMCKNYTLYRTRRNRWQDQEKK